MDWTDIPEQVWIALFYAIWFTFSRIVRWLTGADKKVDPEVEKARREAEDEAYAAALPWEEEEPTHQVATERDEEYDDEDEADVHEQPPLVVYDPISGGLRSRRRDPNVRYMPPVAPSTPTPAPIPPLVAEPVHQPAPARVRRPTVRTKAAEADHQALVRDAVIINSLGVFRRTG